MRINLIENINIKPLIGWIFPNPIKWESNFVYNHPNEEGNGKKEGGDEDGRVLKWLRRKVRQVTKKTQNLDKVQCRQHVVIQPSIRDTHSDFSMLTSSFW